MSEQVTTKLANLLTVRLTKQATEFERQLDSLTLREKVQRLIDLQHTIRKLGVAVAADEGFSRTSAQQRVQVYFERNRGEIVGGDELGVVAGISTYARRVRELRKQKGMTILTGPAVDPATGHKLRTDQYVYPA
jgi:hypothetical protein